MSLSEVSRGQCDYRSDYVMECHADVYLRVLLFQVC